MCRHVTPGCWLYAGVVWAAWGLGCIQQRRQPCCQLHCTLIPASASQTGFSGSPSLDGIEAHTSAGHLAVPAGYSTLPRLGTGAGRCSSSSSCRSLLRRQWQQRQPPSQLLRHLHLPLLLLVLRCRQHPLPPRSSAARPLTQAPAGLPSPATTTTPPRRPARSSPTAAAGATATTLRQSRWGRCDNLSVAATCSLNEADLDHYHDMMMIK